MASRQELIDSIRPDMKLDKSFFMKVYGYELTWLGFAELALAKLEQAGCSKAREYYTCIVAEWSHHHDKIMKNVAEWYKKQDFDRKVVNESRKQQEVEQRKKELLQEKKRLLMQKLKLSTGN